jgi:hypothetical protein
MGRAFYQPASLWLSNATRKPYSNSARKKLRREVRALKRIDSKEIVQKRADIHSYWIRRCLFRLPGIILAPMPVYTQIPLLTIEDYRALPETGPRYQLIEGDLYMAPATQPISSGYFTQSAARENLGEASRRGTRRYAKGWI